MPLDLHRGARSALAAIALSLAVVSAPAVADAQQPKVSLKDAVEKLRSDDADRIRAGIESIGLLGKPQGIEPLAERIRQGLPPELLKTAVDTLSVMGRPEAGPILFELTSHRRPEIRRKAVEALSACKPDGAKGTLVSALSDSDPAVRGVAAVGLGKIDARSAIDSLFMALDRGVLEAAAPIGKLADAKHVDQLLGYLGELPFDRLTPALETILARDDLSERVKLDVIAALQELATAKVKAFLQEFVSSLPPSTRGRDPVRRAAEDAILRIVD